MSFDKKHSAARPEKHGSSRRDKQYEHEEITDNRLVWEVLEEGEKNESS